MSESALVAQRYHVKVRLSVASPAVFEGTSAS